MSSINDEIKKQEALIAATRRKIDAIKEKEAKRILKIAEKAGYFDVTVSDQALEAAFVKLIETTRTDPA